MTRPLALCSTVVAVLGTAATAPAQPVETEPPNAPPPESRPPKDQPERGEERNAVAPGASVFWIDSSLGWQRVGLTTLRVHRDSAGRATVGELVPAVRDGPSASLGLGFRWLVLTVGARVTAAFIKDLSPERTESTSQFYSVDLEVGLRIPAGRFEPYMVFGAGYSVFGGFGDALSGLARGVDIDGGNLRLGFGLDYYLTNTWSIGARATGEFLFLAKSGVPIRDLARAEMVNTVREARTRLADGEGSSAGSAFSVSIGPGLHF
jgi:hypothetical protein